MTVIMPVSDALGWHRDYQAVTVSDSELCSVLREPEKDSVDERSRYSFCILKACSRLESTIITLVFRMILAGKWPERAAFL
jgi:hypothetical protein